MAESFSAPFTASRLIKFMGTAWFVDGGYSSKTWQSVAGWERLDYAALRKFIEADAAETIDEAYYFDCDNDPPTTGQTGFHRFLSSSPPRGPGLRVKLYWLQTKSHEWPKHMGGGPILHPISGEQYITKGQKAVDVGLAFHLMRSFNKRGWNKLYLVAGDGDFSDVIQHLVENENVAVTLIGTSNSVSGELAPYVRIIDFAEIRAKVAKPSTTTRQGPAKVVAALDNSSESPTRTEVINQQSVGLSTSGYKLFGGSSFQSSQPGSVGEVRVTLGRLETGVAQDLPNSKKVDATRT